MISPQLLNATAVSSLHPIILISLIKKMTASLQSQRSDSDTSALYNDFVSCTIVSILLTMDNVPVSDYKYRIT